MLSRDSGFYGVVHRVRDRVRIPDRSEWLIGYWNGKFWQLFGAPYPHHDSDFDAISDQAVEVLPEMAAIIRGSAVFASD